MRVALCISGQPRNVHRGIKILLYNIKIDFDVFIHAWWDSESSKSLFIKSNAAKLNDVVSEPVGDGWLNQIYENYNVKKLLLETQKNFKVSDELERRKTKYANAFNIYSGLYSIYKCNQLKKEYELENNFKYDKVIRSRFDFGFDKILDFEKYDDNIIYVPDDNGYRHNYGFNDQFAIGSSYNMDIYSDMYNNIEKILDSHHSGIRTTSYCLELDMMGHEQLLQKHLENNNVKFEITSFNNFLYRHDGKPDRDTGFAIHNKL
jgi:hypothetical protein